MLKRAHWLGAAVALSIVVAFGVVPFAAGGCQSTCATSSDCGSGSYCSLSTGVCLSAQAVGFCQSIPTECPEVVDLVCGCDGKQYQNQCQAAKARASISATGACSTACGGPSALTCADTTTYCQLPVGSCTQPFAAGTCVEVPTAASCTFPSPVCGCDGKTYQSACAAAAAKVSVGSTGACPCGGQGGVTCQAGEYCSYAGVITGNCYDPGVLGVCQQEPTSCASVISPVCGCDGKDYVNPCEAAKAGTSVGVTGSCSEGGTSDGGTSDGGTSDGGTSDGGGSDGGGSDGGDGGM